MNVLWIEELVRTRRVTTSIYFACQWNMAQVEMPFCYLPS